MKPEFNKLNNPRLHSTLERLDLSERANNNRQFKPEIEKFYSNHKQINYTFYLVW